jgi:hypothetical protein
MLLNANKRYGRICCSVCYSYSSLRKSSILSRLCLTCSPNIFKILGFDVFTAVVMKINNFCDIMPCSPLKVKNVSEEYYASIFRVEKHTAIYQHESRILIKNVEVY